MLATGPNRAHIGPIWALMGPISGLMAPYGPRPGARALPFGRQTSKKARPGKKRHVPFQKQLSYVIFEGLHKMSVNVLAAYI